MILGAQAFRGVFDDLQVVLASRFHNRVHVHRMSEHVDGQDRGDAAARRLVPQARRRLHAHCRSRKSRTPLRVHLPIVGLGVDQHGPRAEIPNRIDRGDERQIGNEHFVIRLNADHAQGDVQGGGAVDRRHRPAAADVGRHRLLEAVDERPDRGDPVGVQAFLDVFPLVAPDFGDGERNESRVGRGTRFKRLGRHPFRFHRVRV